MIPVCGPGDFGSSEQILCYFGVFKKNLRVQTGVFLVSLGLSIKLRAGFFTSHPLAREVRNEQETQLSF